MTFNPQRAEALRTAILGTAQSLRHSPEGDVRTLLTEHLALLQEAELIYLTDAFVGEGEEQIGAESERVLPDLNEFAARNEKFAKDNGLRGDPHAELRKTWAPGQRWQRKEMGGDWVDTPKPSWLESVDYRRHPDDIDQSKPWYPDDSGEWVEVPDDCVDCPVPHTTRVQFLYAKERKAETFNDQSAVAGDICWDARPHDPYRIVAYKVVK